MIQDPRITGAVAGILHRSEKQQDVQKLLGTFVDVGIRPQLANFNNQIVYGRRGTGKTHIFKVLVSEFEQDPHNTVVYIDARTLGSTSQFSDSSLPLKTRCLSLFRDILAEIHNALLQHIIEFPPADMERAFASLAALDELAAVSTEPVVTVTEEGRVDRARQADTTETKASLSAKVGPAIAFEAARQRTTADEQEVTRNLRVSSEDKVVFPALQHALTDVLSAADTRLVVLIDEWSSLPMDIQPYLAEFLKRSFLPNANVVLKVASLEYRSNFGIRIEGQGILGFELGADVSTSIDIDDYYVYDRNPDRIKQAFADMLYRHIRSELPEGYLETQYRIASPDDFIRRMFTNEDVFIELVRAAEGVVRDLINIFSKSFFDAHRRGRDSIDRRAILEAARQWFEQDKSRNLDDKLRSVLERVVSEVIGRRKARSFLLPRELEKHPVVHGLFDARVLHLMQRGYADKDNPGVRHNIYTLDYGTYVDLINTSKQPEIDLFDPEAKEGITSDDIVVPFDDRRSIRRIVLPEGILQ